MKTRFSPPMLIRHDDPRLAWEGAISVETTRTWSMPWRIPHKERDLYPFLEKAAAWPAGIRLSFLSNATFLEGHVVPHLGNSLMDLFCNGEFHGSADLSGRDHFRFDRLPSGSKWIELWLPQCSPFRLKSLLLNAGARLAPFRDRRPRWITHGSSITQCRTAFSPSQTWPSLVARKHHVHLTCLGYGGQCHLDPMVARLIRNLPADFISLCAGINIYGQSSLNLRTFQPALLGFIKTIRDSHPSIPVALISPIFSCQRETTPNAAGYTLRTLRKEVATAANVLQSYGDRNLKYFNGLRLFGSRSKKSLPDNLHPNGKGYLLIGKNFSSEIVPFLFRKSRKNRNVR